MKLVNQFREGIKEKNLFTAKDKLLLAVSGGLDSIVLCALCKQAGYDFIIAHCNFQLRGEESERDEQFVRETGKQYQVETLVRKFNTEAYAVEHKLSVQEAARELRYAWFETLLNSPDASTAPKYLVTAHHADDNIETAYMHFFRGTGLHGLTGIPVINGFIRRPLLTFTKAELLTFANEQGLAYVEDSSNVSSKYTRNFFRHEIIPAIAKVYPQVNHNILENIQRFNEIEKLYQFTVGELKKKLLRQKGKELYIPVKQLLGYQNKALIYEIIRAYGFTEKQVDEVMKLAVSNSGKYIVAPDQSHRIINHRHWFIISPTETTVSFNILVEEKNQQLNFPAGIFSIEKMRTVKIQSSAAVVQLDAKMLRFPLLLRKWKTGDYFYPLGMKKKKKLSRFFIDLKLSRTQKENLWVLESDQRIAWVIGYRIDDRFKITDKTTSAWQCAVQ